MAVLGSKELDGVLMVYFKDAKILDENVIQQVGTELTNLAAQATDKRMLVNFTGVTFMSSAMIGKLVALHKYCKQAGITLKLCNICDNIGEVFKIMGLTKVFDIYKDEQKAVKSYDKKGWFGLG